MQGSKQEVTEVVPLCKIAEKCVPEQTTVIVLKLERDDFTFAADDIHKYFLLYFQNVLLWHYGAERTLNTLNFNEQIVFQRKEDFIFHVNPLLGRRFI